MSQQRYAFLVKSVDISGIGNIASEDGNVKLISMLTNIAMDLSKLVPQIDDGNFIVVSHDTTISGSFMTITFLLRNSNKN